MTTLFYIHDPMCSWCWGYAPTWITLQKKLPSSISVEYIAGGLAPDSDKAMPVSQQQMIQNHWRTIEKKLGTKFNHNFWRNNTPRRSTYNACRAALAAHNQGFQAQMIEAIQQGYYLQALNPSDNEVLINIASTLRENLGGSFDLPKFIEDLQSTAINEQLVKQRAFARDVNSQGFPSLVLFTQGQYFPIVLDYLNAEITLTDIVNKCC